MRRENILKYQYFTCVVYIVTVDVLTVIILHLLIMYIHPGNATKEFNSITDIFLNNEISYIT